MMDFGRQSFCDWLREWFVPPVSGAQNDDGHRITAGRITLCERPSLSPSHGVFLIILPLCVTFSPKTGAF